ncbi:hypothetical protein CQW23_31723 [Capsicum baccatum]|uniref:Serine/threonine-protein kinase TOR n=1 Tax=Capsicum baccatum TaxID=33114 RepID=A0A2G2V6T1_CAPBA|nr:hypothetical protein CQW23_31723 [Capsicum baccatum]
MGSSSQAIRYPVATTDAGNIDALNRVFADLCTRRNLRRLVEEEARDLSGEAFACFMDHLYELITIYLDSNEVSENLGALRAIDELIDVTISENASKEAKFSNYMSAAFETRRDPEILVIASKVLDHLDRSGGAMTADKVERQVKVSLEWLRGERIEYRRFAAVLILKEMVENASTVFNVHVAEFVDAIWVALRDPTLVFREKAIEAYVRAFVLLKSVRQGGVFSEPRTGTSMEPHSTLQLGIVHLLPKVEILATRSSHNGWRHLQRPAQAAPPAAAQIQPTSSSRAFSGDQPNDPIAATSVPAIVPPLFYSQYRASSQPIRSSSISFREMLK